MNRINLLTKLIALAGMLAAGAFAQDKPAAAGQELQDKVEISGTPIPAQLLKQNYGKMPKNIGAFDLNICNVSNQGQTLLASQIFRDLSQSNVSLTPIGRQIMLASVLRNQQKGFSAVLGVALDSAVGAAALLSTSRSLSLPSGVTSGLALGAILLHKLTGDLQPVLPPDKLEKFDREVLESALVLEPGACAERTVFTVLQMPSARNALLRFHVR